MIWIWMDTKLEIQTQIRCMRMNLFTGKCKDFMQIFLNRNGGTSTMGVDLNMDGYQISYLKEPEYDHNVATKGYADTKLPLNVGSMQRAIGLAENRISHLGEALHENDAVRRSSVNEFYLRRDRSNWMRNNLSLGAWLENCGINTVKFDSVNSTVLSWKCWIDSGAVELIMLSWQLCCRFDSVNFGRCLTLKKQK